MNGLMRSGSGFNFLGQIYLPYTFFGLLYRQLQLFSIMSSLMYFDGNSSMNRNRITLYKGGNQDGSKWSFYGS